MKILYWLDDLRNPNDKIWINKYNLNNYDVLWIKNYKDFINYIQTNNLPDIICFDHDLGLSESGYDCAKFLVNYCLDNDLDLPIYYIQSSNPAGKENIDCLFKNFIKMKNKNK